MVPGLHRLVVELDGGDPAQVQAPLRRDAQRRAHLRCNHPHGQNNHPHIRCKLHCATTLTPWSPPGSKTGITHHPASRCSGISQSACLWCQQSLKWLVLSMHEWMDQGDQGKGVRA